jgi:hypothetical protein
MEHVLADIFSFMKVVVICLTGLVALLLVLMAIPKSPIRDFVFSLTKRAGVTAAALALAPPMDAIPVTGEVYDIIALIGVAYYWYTLFRKQLPPAASPD